MERRAKDHEKCALRGHFRALSLILLALLYVSPKEHSLPLGLPRLTLGKDKQDVTAQCTSRDPGKPEVTSGFLSLHSQAGDSGIGTLHLSAGRQIRGEGSKGMYVAFPACGLLYPALVPHYSHAKGFQSWAPGTCRCRQSISPGLKRVGWSLPTPAA